jgi:aspartyl-tRNA(Asn)/glutamyl-tRNA(Gln) amidotransferase subunit A
MTGDDQLACASISEIGKLFRRRKLSPVELTRFMLERIRRWNSQLNAYITVSEGPAIEMAQQAEAELCVSCKKRTSRDRGPLHGIPISLKDNIYSKDIRTTAGSKILSDFVPLHDAPVVRSLKAAGVVLLGKTNMHEFAFGVTTENPHFGTTRNPWDRQRIAGGSSGGSAAALAAGLCYGSIGTDTGGSIRIPCSFCGVVGLKPSLARVNPQDIVPLSPILDFVGPLARNVEDAMLLLQPILIAREKKRDSKIPPSRGRRACLGIPKEFFLEVLEPEVQAGFQSAVELLKKHGARIKEVSLPQLPATEQAGNQIAWVEATMYHRQAGWFPEHNAEYSPEVYQRLELGTKVTAVEYLNAMATRDKFKEQIHDVFTANALDALVVPTTPITAPKIGEDSIVINGNAHPTRALLLRLNRPANLAGIPAISVPCGLSTGRLPIGLQFIASWKEEALLLAIAREFERACNFAARPNLELPG